MLMLKCKRHNRHLRRGTLRGTTAVERKGRAPTARVPETCDPLDFQRHCSVLVLFVRFSGTFYGMIVTRGREPAVGGGDEGLGERIAVIAAALVLVTVRYSLLVL